MNLFEFILSMLSFVLFIILSSALVTVAAIGNEVKYETSNEGVLDYFKDPVNKSIEFGESCFSIDLKILAAPDLKTKKIAVIFGLSDIVFKNCFAFFDIILKEDEEIVYSAKYEFNFTDTNMDATHYIFDDVTCGSYEVGIVPCITKWQCMPKYIKFPERVNITSADCIEHPLKMEMLEIHRQSLEKKILLITTVVAITSLLIIGFSYHLLASRKLDLASQMKKKLLIGGEIEKNVSHKATTRRVEVFIINHYNNITLRKVEMLKDFMSVCPNLDITLIEDGLAISLITGSEWLNNMLQKDENDEVIKKLIIVDSIEEMEDLENENENATFYEAIKKLSCDWSRSLDDYDNLFVVHFNSSFTKLKELDYIVKRVRYCIPDHLITLCLNLMSGTHYDAREMEEKLRNLLCKHDIRKVGIYNV